MGSTLKFAARLVVGLTALTTVAVGLSTISGCGPERTLPGVETAGSEPSTTGPTAAIPEKSEEPARKVVERAIKAMTDGHPERLDKATVNRSVAKGHLFQNQQFVETTRTVQSVYPDRLRVEYEFKAAGNRLTIGLRRPSTVWARTSSGEAPFLDTQQFYDVVSVDALGTYWFATLTPLADPKTVVFGLGATTAGGKTFDTVKATVSGFPGLAFTVWFDREQGLARRVEYTHAEAGAPVPKVLRLDQYKAFGGLTLPAKIDYARGHQDVELWTVESWEFPDRIDDAAFEQPK